MMLFGERASDRISLAIMYALIPNEDLEECYFLKIKKEDPVFFAGTKTELCK